MEVDILVQVPHQKHGLGVCRALHPDECADVPPPENRPLHHNTALLNMLHRMARFLGCHLHGTLDFSTATHPEYSACTAVGGCFSRIWFHNYIINFSHVSKVKTLGFGVLLPKVNYFHLKPKVSHFRSFR